MYADAALRGYGGVMEQGKLPLELRGLAVLHIVEPRRDGLGGVFERVANKRTVQVKRA